MDNPGDLMHLCRLCLVKDQVNIPIFEEHGDIRQIFVKISSCLPVKVSKDDQLPKRICDGCSNKLDLLYEFCNTSANSEKKLLSWLEQAGLKDVDTISAVAQHTAKPLETQTQVKQEALEDIHAAVQQTDHLELTDEGVGAAVFEENAIDESDEPPPPKRARRTAAVKAQINITPDSDDDDDDMDISEPMTKVEDESDDSDVDKDPSYVDVPGTSADDQPGPSGVGKDGVEAPTDILTGILPDGEEIFIHFVDEEEPNNIDIANDELIEEEEEILKLMYDDEDTNACEQETTTSKPDRKLQCNICGRSFKYLMRHLQCHGPHNCTECLINFETKEEYDDHMRQHVPNAEPFRCEECNVSYLTPTDIALHNFEHTQKYSCPLCDFTAKGRSKVTLINHIKRHEGKFGATCEICGQGFITEHFLKSHREIHEAIPKYECEFCNKKFTVHRYMYVHKTLNHKKEMFGIEEAFQCEVCGKRFTFEKSLKRHLSCIHKIGEDRTVECPICHKIIANNHNLKKHMRLHTGEKQFCCDICGRAFADKKYLTAHRNVHEKEKLRKVQAAGNQTFLENDEIEYLQLRNSQDSPPVDQTDDRIFFDAIYLNFT